MNGYSGTSRLLPCHQEGTAGSNRLNSARDTRGEVEQRFVDARVTMADGLTWLERGFSVEEICLHLPMERAGN